MLNNISLSYLYQRTTEGSIAGPAATQVILCLPTHILIESKEYLSLTVNICID